MRVHEGVRMYLSTGREPLLIECVYVWGYVCMKVCECICPLGESHSSVNVWGYVCVCVRVCECIEGVCLLACTIS